MLTSATLSLFFLFTIPTHQEVQAQAQCARQLPPPEHPFRVIWNHPDRCGQITQYLKKYGFTYNHNREFGGDVVRLVYEYGKWPTYSAGEPHNGGLPQLVNDTTFNETRMLVSSKEFSNFTGLAAICFLTWRANYFTNWGPRWIYKTLSVSLVRQRHPDYTIAKARGVAAREWDEAVKRLFLAKLSIGQEMVPGAYWGYYGYPRTWGVDVNNKMAWLWQQATALYPRREHLPYTKASGEERARVSRQRRAFVVKEMKEAVRIQQTFSPPNTPIYLYTRSQHNANDFYLEDQMRDVLEVAADMGASGVIIWGSSLYYRVSGQCQRLATYLQTQLGPLVKNLTHFIGNCSATRCGGHGRCVHNSLDSQLSEEDAIDLSDDCCHLDNEYRFRDYHCRCYSPWAGPCCDEYRPEACQR